MADFYFECHWPGVTCSSSSEDDGRYDYMRVLELNARGSSSSGGGATLLRGELPIELIFLQHLETLDISHNLIEGRGDYLGSIFKKLMNLRQLDLNDNRFVSSFCLIHACFSSYSVSCLTPCDISCIENTRNRTEISLVNLGICLCCKNLHCITTISRDRFPKKYVICVLKHPFIFFGPIAPPTLPPTCQKYHVQLKIAAPYVSRGRTWMMI